MKRIWCITFAILLAVSTMSVSFAEENISRADAVAEIWKLEGSPDSQGDSAFTDVADGAENETAVIWATAWGVTKGVSVDTFGAEEAVSREQLATLLYRFAEKNNAVAEAELANEIADIEQVRRDSIQTDSRL